ncbi:MAG: DUF488 family protein [Gemmatimonadales bacterium]
MIRITRAYDPPSADDGRRFLIDRLWPRGRTKAALKIERWLRHVAPSDALRKDFQHDPAKWPEFRKRYLAELRANPDGLETLVDAARTGTVTLVYAARDERHNNAVVVREFLTRRTRSRRPPAS